MRIHNRESVSVLFDRPPDEVSSEAGSAEEAAVAMKVALFR